VRTRTWLTTPPDQSPIEDDRSAGDGERYVPAPGLPREPRVPGPHRRVKLVLVAAAVTIVVVALLVLAGEEAQREDPAVPGGPGQDEAPPQLELPES
jgi:hypothetical protein